MDPRRRNTALLAIVVLLAGVGIAVAITGTVPVSDGVSLQAPGGMTTTLEGSTDAHLEEPFPTSGTVEWTTEAGNVSFFSSGTANATIHKDDIEGTWTNVTTIDADPNSVTINPGDKDSAIVAQEVDEFAWRAGIQEDDGTVDFVYDSSGPGEVTVQGVSGNQEMVAVDADSGTFLDVATSNGGGAVAFDALDSGSHDVEIRSSDFNDPTLENPTPTGDLTSEPSDIEIDVADADFPNGDSVDVAIDLDGSQIHSETITANQTVSVSVPSSGQNAGTHTWDVTATPDFGNPTDESYEYQIPSNLTIRNELNHTEVVDTPVTSDVTFFSDDQIVTRSTSDGTINLTGLPVNDDFIAEVEPDDDNWTQRAIWFESIYQQQDVYLLNTSAVDVTEGRFVLDDPTAQFGSSTVLFIQRPINITGTTTWQTVHADEFGAEGVTATLEEGQRYRLRLRSAGGTTQVVGPYRATLNETVEVQPGTPGIEMGEYEDGWAANAELNNQTLTYAYDDPTGETDQLTVWIHEKSNVSNRLTSNASYFDLGQASAQEPLTANESDKTWVVNFVVDREGETFIKSVDTSNRRDLFGEVPEPWQSGIGIGLLVLFAGVFSRRNVATGAVAVAAVGGVLFFIGLLTGLTTGIGIVLGMFAAVVNQLRQSGGP